MLKPEHRLLSKSSPFLENRHSLPTTLLPAVMTASLGHMENPWIVSLCGVGVATFLSESSVHFRKVCHDSRGASHDSRGAIST